MANPRTKDIAEGQKLLEAHVQKTLYENNVNQAETVNGMMKCRDAGCDFEAKSLSFAFPIQPWQANRVGNLHGGLICTAFDVTIAALARFYAGANFAPTVSLDVKYIRPAKVGDEIVVTAKATATGRRITQLTAEAYSRDTGKLLATAASVYMNVDTEKERAQQG